MTLQTQVREALPEEFSIFPVAGPSIFEAFFSDPAGLRRAEPDVYQVLRDFYRQDPAAWDGG